MQHELSVLALMKGQERYIYVYDAVSHGMLIDAIRDQAASPEYGLNWYDVRILTEKARQQMKDTAVTRTLPE